MSVSRSSGGPEAREIGQEVSNTEILHPTKHQIGSITIGQIGLPFLLGGEEDAGRI